MLPLIYIYRTFISLFVFYIYAGQVQMRGQNLVIVKLDSNPQYVSDVRNALINSSMNVNPRIDGNTVYVDIPKITGEARKMMAKSAKVVEFVIHSFI